LSPLAVVSRGEPGGPGVLRYRER